MLEDGNELGSKALPITVRGYGQAMRWAAHYTGEGRRAWSMESTRSYGAGLAAALAAKGESVIEFDHPGTKAAKDDAKSDSREAVRAARTCSGTRVGQARGRGVHERLRTFIAGRDNVKIVRGAVINALKALVVTAG